MRNKNKGLLESLQEILWMLGCLYMEKLTRSQGTDRATFSTTTYRTAYMFSPLFKPAENRSVPSHVHTNPFFFSFLTIRRSVHTKPVNPLTKTESF